MTIDREAVAPRGASSPGRREVRTRRWRARDSRVRRPERPARLRWRRVMRAGGAAPRPAARSSSRAAAQVVLRLGEPSRRAWSAAGVAVVAGCAGLLVAGPVAAFGLACYGATGTVLGLGVQQARALARARASAVDSVSILAAELRAGLPAATALDAAGTHLLGLCGAGARAVLDRLACAVQVAQSSGAPLADVLDRLDLHLRASERARRAAEAQAAGARASAALLAVLPAAGVGLGYAIGIDPARVLLHTPLGAACLCTAIVLQLAGLAWSRRLSRVEVAP